MDNAERIRSIRQELSDLDNYLKLFYSEDFGGYIIPQQITQRIIYLHSELATLTAEGQTE